MRSVLKIALKGILKRKTYTIAIIFLTLIAALSMATALGTLTRTEEISKNSLEKSNIPDMLYGYYDEFYSKDYEDFFKGRDEVEKTLVQDYLEMLYSAGINNEDFPCSVFMPYNPDENDFAVIPEKRTLKKGEIYSPIIYQDTFHAKLGDKIKVKTPDGDKEYTIAGFIEDTLLSSNFSGMKRNLLNHEDFLELKNFNSASIKSSKMLNIYLKDNYEGEIKTDTMELLNKDFGKDLPASISITAYQISRLVLLIPNIISILLIIFSMLLMIIVLIVIRHAILSSIEADFISFGVLKAIGFTSKNIIESIVIQYLIISLFGIASGMLLSTIALPYIGEMLISTTGLLWDGNLTPILIISITCILLLFILISAYLTAKKSSAITPVMAISFGKAPVHFSSRLNIPLKYLSFMPLNLKMALKQMLTRLKQYSTLIVITCMFSFMIATITAIIGNFSTTAKINSILGFSEYDFNIASNNQDKCDEKELIRIKNEISETYKIKNDYSNGYANVKINGINTEIYLNGNFNDYKQSLIEGRLPEYDNEIVLTPLMSKLLKKNIGDFAEIESAAGNKKDFIISGIYQNVSDAGRTFGMLTSAYKTIQPGYQELRIFVKLEDNADLDNIILELKEKYAQPESGISILESNVSRDSAFATMKTSIWAASTLCYVLTLILVACITFLLCNITLYKEITDTGIFKAVGFKNGQLRIQFCIRFMLISVIGGIIGTTLSFVLDEKLIGTAFSSAGLARIYPEWSFMSLGFPLLFVVAVTGITAMLCSLRIKKISPRSLINE